LITGLYAGKYSDDLVITFTRIIAGFLLGGGFGLFLGLLMGWSQRLRSIVDPIVAALHPIPKFALLPMIIIWFGIGESSRIALVSIGAFFPLVINSMAGVVQIPTTYYEVLESYGASQFDIFRKVVWPGSLPFVLTGARLSLRSALTLTIGVEMVFSNTGLGSALWLSWQTMRMIDMYAILLLIAVIGVGLVGVLELFKRRLTPWHQGNHRGM
jgi:NitT/TauT family transport system permease protein